MSRDERRKVRRGYVFRAAACVLLLALCGVFAYFVGDQDRNPTIIGWVPLIAVGSAIVLAFVYVRLLARSLVLLEKSDAIDCRRGENVRFTVRFRNRGILFFFRLEAHFFTADLEGNPVNHAATTVALAPRERYDMPFVARFEHIGTYSAGLDRVVIYDFLRLFSKTVPGPRRTRVQVTPQLVAVPEILFSNDAVVETTKAARSALSDSMDYAAAREYVMGDPMKNVHWKLSSRTDELMVKLFETYTNPGVAVILDFYGPGAGALELMDMFDAVVETGFSVARYARTRGMDTEVLYTDQAGSPVHRSTWRESDLPLIVSEMPAFTSQPEAAADAIRLLDGEIRSIHGQSNLIVCSANLSSQMMETIVSAKLHRREPIMFAVVPQGLEGRERDRWLAPLKRLDAAGIGYVVLSSSSDLLGVHANVE